MLAIWIVCTLAAAIWTARSTPAEAPHRWRVLLASAAFGPCLMLVEWGLRFAADTVKLQYDQILFAVDGSFGVQASFVLGGWFRRWFVLAALCKGAYDGVPIAILIVLLRQAWKDPSWRFARALVANFAIAYALYFLLPAAGPVYAFAGSYPDYAPAIAAPVAMKLYAFPNAMPSVHFSTALLLFWNSGVYRFGRWVFAVYLVLVGLATLGTGEHYLVDLVVALPYAALLQSLGWRRVNVFAAGLLLAWLLLLRLAPGILIHTPLLLWGLTAGTIVGQSILVSRST